MGEPGVALVATPTDAHAAAVGAAIRARGVPVVRFDLATAAHGTIAVVPGRGVRIGDDEITDGWSVWWRRPGVTSPRFEYRPDEALSAANETRDILIGGLLGLDLGWVDEPFAMLRAEYKLLQLAAAASLGVAVPASVATNDPATGRELHRGGPTIAKPMTTTGGILVHVETVSDADLDRLVHAPTFLQRAVDGQADARVVVIGERAYVWQRPRRTGEPIDWRAPDPAGRGFVHAPHDAIAAAAVAVNARLDITFGVHDWVIDRDGTPVFLEANPGGAFLFLAGAADAAVPALADHLIAARR